MKKKLLEISSENIIILGETKESVLSVDSLVREEIMNGNSPNASIYAGYQKAFSTISLSWVLFKIEKIPHILVYM